MSRKPLEVEQRDFAVQHLLIENKTIKEIADIVGLHRTSIYASLKRFDNYISTDKEYLKRFNNYAPKN